ncbi:MAG: DAK2 domain-containing protein [Defluviitaleaceae bacterium]|nr:DAK2 domain-containing protein [Defluviitaleaceae bacterium]
MALIKIDGRILKNMFVGGSNEVTRNTGALNALNVFPVPDGDTGTNMGHTVRAAAKEAIAGVSPNIAAVAKAASNGALRGARGNSGVILSQLFRGFARGLEGKSVANAEELAEALAKSSEMAYKAVMKPKEGTMLTIGRAMAEAAHEVAFDEQDVAECLSFVVEKSDKMLQKTPQMLPVLKQAGVVDSGGMGIVLFLKGALAALNESGDIELIETVDESAEQVVAGEINPDDIKFAYCTEFLIELSSAGHSPGHSQNAEETLRAYLPTIGDSVVVIEDAGLVKVHVHTNNPGKAMEKALQFGMLVNIKIDNMKAQNADLSPTDFSTSNEPPKAVGIVAVASGAGTVELFKGLGAGYVIEGGQSMNPSAEDIARAIDRVNAETVIVLPNNKNITLTAEQAGKLTKKSVRVVPTKNVPQGVACMVANDESADIQANIDGMNEAIEAVHCGQITKAVRDTVLNGIDIKEGDFLCIYDGEIAFVRKSLQSAARALADHMLKPGGDIVSVYHGEGATADSAEKLGEYIAQKHPDIEFEVYDGGQPIYSYVMSVE